MLSYFILHLIRGAQTRIVTTFLLFAVTFTLMAKEQNEELFPNGDCADFSAWTLRDTGANSSLGYAQENSPLNGGIEDNGKSLLISKGEGDASAVTMVATFIDPPVVAQSTFAFDINVDSLVGSKTVVALRTPGEKAILYLLIDSAYADDQLRVGDGTSWGAKVGPLSAGEWSRIEVKLDFATKSYSITIIGASGETSVLEDRQMLPEMAGEAQTLGQILVTGDNGNPAEAQRILFDNFSYRIGNLKAKDNPGLSKQTPPAEFYWVEAEDFQKQNFLPGPVVNFEPGDLGASEGVDMRLKWEKTPSTEKRLPFFLQYSVNIKNGGEYALWLAATPQNQAWATPFKVQINEGEVIDLKGVSPHGGQYGENVFSWSMIRLKLETGINTIRFIVDRTRESEPDYFAFLDSFFLTPDLTFKPSGWASWKPKTRENIGKMSTADLEATTKAVKDSIYFHWIDTQTQEEITDATVAEVISKLAGRSKHAVQSAPPTFGVSGGLEWPTVFARTDGKAQQQMYDLLAQAGVQSVNTGDTFWHRLGTNVDNFVELDYQLANAKARGMKVGIAVGYPPGSYTVAGHHLSALKPEHEQKYRAYLKKVFSHLEKDKGSIAYVKALNEPDAPEVWYKMGTPDHYVNECRIIKEEMDENFKGVPLYILGCTYSRDATRTSKDEGRGFVKQCFEKGIAQYGDGYVLHYIWSKAEIPFYEWFKAEVAKYAPDKPLINLEDAGYYHPSDIIKLFVRNAFVYRSPITLYYTAMDYNDSGYLVSSGLFDIHMRPKLRLLSFAAATDAMRERDLVGIANLPNDVEAYVLKEREPGQGSTAPFAVVIWRNGSPEEVGSDAFSKALIEDVVVDGFRNIKKVFDWRLNSLPVQDGQTAVSVGPHPIIVYSIDPPDFSLIGAEEWIRSAKPVPSKSHAMVPGK